MSLGQPVWSEWPAGLGAPALNRIGYRTPLSRDWADSGGRGAGPAAGAARRLISWKQSLAPGGAATSGPHPGKHPGIGTMWLTQSTGPKKPGRLGEIGYVTRGPAVQNGLLSLAGLLFWVGVGGHGIDPGTSLEQRPVRPTPLP